MQKIAAIHDGNTQGWETVYLAIHVAARMGASLLVLTLVGGEAEASSSGQAEKILTGARAAGLSAETSVLEQLSPEAILQKAGEPYMLMLPKDLARGDGLLEQLSAKIACPIWVVTAKYEIRQLGAWLERPDQGTAVRYATALARRLGQPLVLFAELQPETPPAESDIVIRTVGEISGEELAEQVSREQIDMLIFGAQQVPIFEKCMEMLDCILALCPPEQADVLN
jgi:nucleotide-binding universal stress UspA family protein